MICITYISIYEINSIKYNTKIIISRVLLHLLELLIVDAQLLIEEGIRASQCIEVLVAEEVWNVVDGQVEWCLNEAKVIEL